MQKLDTEFDIKADTGYFDKYPAEYPVGYTSNRISGLIQAIVKVEYPVHSCTDIF